jgi:hypothetical protein
MNRFASAVYGTIRNKEIVEHFPYPALLTASHFACGALIDWAGNAVSYKEYSE